MCTGIYSSNSHFPPLNSHHFGTDSHTPETKIVIKSLLRTQTSQLGKKVFGGEILLLLHSACKTCGFCLILLYYCSQINALEAMFFSPLAIGKWILLDFDGAGFLFLHTSFRLFQCPITTQSAQFLGLCLLHWFFYCILENYQALL